jgi:hypothetical protein
MRIESFEPEHMLALIPRLNTDQTLDPKLFTPQFCENMARTCDAFTGFAEDGRVVVIAGTLQFWPERYHLFAYMAKDAGPYMTSITRGVKRYLDTVYGRLETQVSAGFPAGHRWVRMLGFKCETPEGMEWFFPDRRVGFMYSKVTQ